MAALAGGESPRVARWPRWPVRLAVILLAGTVTCGHAQGWRPQKAFEMLVPTAPGGSLDSTARRIQSSVQTGRLIDFPLAILNKPGGGGSIALSYLDQHQGDGHYLLISTMSIMTNHIQGRSKANYTDYTPLATLFSEYMTLVVKPDSPLKTGRDIQERLRRDPQSLSFAVGLALGAANHLTVALLAKAMGVDVKKMKTVVFQSNGDAQTALLGGHVDLSALSMAAALRGSQDGMMRIIGVTSEKRGEGPLAGISTWKEQGYDVVFSNTRLLFGAKGMSPAQTAFWDAVLVQVVESAEWKQEVEKNQAVADYANSKQTPQRMAVIYNQLKGALIDAGLAK
jgi:putative tricarboxylic transport membrane protein